MLQRDLIILMVATVLCFLRLLNAQTQGTYYRERPDYIIPCYRDDPMLSECIKLSFCGIVRKAANGIPELDIPPLEPLFKDEIDTFNVAGFDLKITNVTLRGMSTLQVLTNSASMPTSLYNFQGKVDKLEVDCNYEISGLFMIFPIRATGSIHAVGNDVKFNTGGVVELASNNGIEFVEVKDVYMESYITEGMLWIRNLGPFEDAINRLLNNRFNARFIMNHVTPIIAEAMVYIIDKFSNRMLNSVPLDTLLLKGAGPVPVTTLEPLNDNAFHKYKKFEFHNRIWDVID